MTKANRVIQKRPIGNPISDYLLSRDFHYQRQWTLSDGVFYTKVNGEWMNEKEFREKYPIKTTVNFCYRPSPDSTKDFLF